MKLSIVILTYNSEKYLHEVLTSTQFADEVLLIDSGSVDSTYKIAEGFKNTKIIKQNWLGFGKQKQVGVERAKNKWIFILDSDEIITAGLKDEILTELENPTCKSYKIPRLNYFFGKPIKTMGLYPDYTIRLFHKNYAQFDGKDVHESVVTSKRVGIMKNHFIHYAYETIEQFITKQNRYSSLNAKPNKFKALFNPYWTFFRLFILKLGFLEGYRGFIIAKLYAQYTFWKYIK